MERSLKSEENGRNIVENKFPIWKYLLTLYIKVLKLHQIYFFYNHRKEFLFWLFVSFILFPLNQHIDKTFGPCCLCEYKLENKSTGHNTLKPCVWYKPKSLIFFILHENKQGEINLSLSRHNFLSKKLKNARKILENHSLSMFLNLL